MTDITRRNGPIERRGFGRWSTRFAALRPRAQRRPAVVATVAVLAGAMAVDLSVDGSVGNLAALVAILVTIGGWALLRHLTRLVTDLPDDVLDEHEVAIRDRVYLDAYRIVAATIIAAAVSVLFLPLDLQERAITSDRWGSVVTGTIAVFLIVPPAVLAWTLPDDCDDA